MDLIEASKSGDRRATLEALRDRLASALTYGGDVKSLAPLANQLRATLIELERLPVPGVGSVVDDLATRRDVRRSTATGGDVSTGGDVVGH